MPPPTPRENVRYLPASGAKRVYIIDEVHRLSGAAFDALLKTLEEPPEHVLFIFATTEPSKVPETILSRTQRYDFKRVAAVDLAKHLRHIADQEQLDITDEALNILARKADGSVRDSLSLMDQIAAYAGEKIGQEEVVGALGLVDMQLLLDFTEAIAASDAKSTLALVKKVLDGGTDVKDFVTELLEHFRLLMIVKATGAKSELLELSEADIATLAKQAEFFELGDLIRMTKIGADLLTDLRQTGLDQRLLIEVAAVRMSELESTVKLEQVLGFLKEGQSGQPNGGTDLFGAPEKKKDSPAPARTELKRPPEKTPPPPPSFPTRNVNLPTIQSGWKKFLGFLKQKNVMLSSQLAMAEVKSVHDNKITAVFASSGKVARQVVERQDNLNLIASCLREHFGANLTIGFEVDINHKPKETPVVSDEPRAQVSELVKNSPRLRMLLEKVEGEIIGVAKRK